MQTTIYYTAEDSYLIDKVEDKAMRERKSKSAVILTILEEYFERDKRLGEILVDLGKITWDDLSRGLEIQTQRKGRRLGEILLNEQLIDERDLRRALFIQHRDEQR
ncbi:MAG: hypothetical protein ACE5JP_15815 [Candidatus Bipolaricaulia bacterium]